MIFSKDIVDTILRHKQAKEVCVIKNLFNEVPSWEEFIEYINEASNSKEKVFPDPLGEYDLNLGAKVIGSVMIKENFYFYITTHRHIGKSQQIIDDFKEAFSFDLGISTIYINLSNKISNIPQHTDMLHNFYWQCQGTVEWLFKDQTYLIEPGDLVYIPASSLHGVNFSVPRAAVGFASYFGDSYGS